MINLTSNWESVLPHMVSLARRNSSRIFEFEQLIIQHPESAAQYAASIIRGTWPEAEEIISTNASASFNYARNVLRDRWAKGEQAISSNANIALSYAREVLRGTFPAAESTIAKNSGASHAYATQILKSRFIAGEASIAKTQTDGSVEWVKSYYDLVISEYSDWKDWTEDQLKISPCWMYMYAKDHLKGRLPDVLHNHMLTFGMTLKDDYYVKKYFKAKRYQKKLKYRRKKFATISEEVNSVVK